MLVQNIRFMGCVSKILSMYSKENISLYKYNLVFHSLDYTKCWDC